MANGTVKIEIEGATLGVGDAVVYAAHGVGRVVAREQRDVAGAARECLVVDLVTGLRVTLPAEDAAERLRPVRATRTSSRSRKSWLPRPVSASGYGRSAFRRARRSSRRGAAELAELVRDGALLEATGNGSRLSHQERRVYVQARDLLARELAWAQGLDVEQVEAWIDAQIGSKS